MCLQLTLIPSPTLRLSHTLSLALKKFFKLAASNRIRRALRNHRPAVVEICAVTCWRVIHHQDKLNRVGKFAVLKTFRGQQEYARTHVDNKDNQRRTQAPPTMDDGISEDE